MEFGYILQNNKKEGNKRMRVGIKVVTMLCICTIYFTGCSMSTENNTENNTKNIGETTTSSEEIMSIDDAKAKAVEYIGIEEEMITKSFVEEEEEDGIPVYDVTMMTPDKKYECVMQREDGVLLSLEYEVLSPAISQTGTPLSEEKIKEIIKENVEGVVKDEMIFVHEDRENGNLVYEGKLQVENRQYELEIDGYSGEILQFKQQLDNEIRD